MATNFSGAQGFLQNPLIATLSPDQQQNLLQLQQRQAVGQALLAQGLQPADYGGANIGGLAYHVSPLNGISKLVNAYVGNKLSMDAMGQQAQLMNGVYGGLFGQDQQPPTVPALPPVSGGADTGALTGPMAGMGGAQGTPDPSTIGKLLVANGQGVTQPGAWTIPGMSAAQSRALYMLNPEEFAKTRMAYVQPTDATRYALASGGNVAQANADQLFHNTYVAPNQGTPGTIARDPRTNQPIYYSPTVPDGAQPVFDASGNLAGVAPLAGAREAIAGAAQARTAGEGAALPYAGFDAAGNSNQIIAKLSQGGMGTDAARAILQSAYPNSHMTQGAINEAADNLIGAQQMVQAKARVLAPLRNSNDAAGYTNAELAFDQNADPRIFQYTGIKDPAARAAFAKNLIAQDPGIVGKIQALQKLGALQ
ncbi:hypothetical protein [Burkholderia orbicola]|uniref:hypothetical protein n=1 Tax=Burkholderia orbicola TaxID=2978683 RepID=UPI002FE19A69